MYDLGNDSWSIHDMDHATLRVAPDSTYKIYDALFGLEEGVKAYSGENLFHDNRIWINYIFCYFIQAPHFFFSATAPHLVFLRNECRIYLAFSCLYAVFRPKLIGASSFIFLPDKLGDSRIICFIRFPIKNLLFQSHFFVLTVKVYCC